MKSLAPRKFKFWEMITGAGFRLV